MSSIYAKQIKETTDEQSTTRSGVVVKSSDEIDQIYT